MICKFFQEYSEIINLLIAILSMIFGAGAWYSAYHIFRHGLQIDKKKIFSQVSLDFVIGFVYPICKFRIAARDTWKSASTLERITWMDVYSIIAKSDIRYDTSFSFWESHKGEVWEILAREGKSKDF